MTLTLPKTCSMGGSKTGLVGTIGVTLLNPDGTTHTARTTTDIYEIGGGCYGKEIVFDDNWLGSIDWDDGGAPAAHAAEEYIYYANNPTIPADVADAVWDELKTGHTIAGSFGNHVGRKLLSVAKFLGLK